MFLSRFSPDFYEDVSIFLFLIFFLIFTSHLFFALQYALYETLGVPPVANSVAPILSTVGGEQGGRAPIVIEDKNIQAADAAPEKVETMADPGKAEPGRDIFAGEAVKDIKSSNVPVQPPAEPVREQKEISSVNFGVTLPSSSASSSPSSSSSSSSSTASDGTAEESASSAASTVSSETATSQSDSTTIESSSSSSATTAVKVQVAGPLGEAELEAQKVANELYPDAAEK